MLFFLLVSVASAAVVCVPTIDHLLLQSVPLCDDSFSKTPCGVFESVCAPECGSESTPSNCFHYVWPSLGKKCRALHSTTDHILTCELDTQKVHCDITQEYDICGGPSRACALQCESSFNAAAKNGCVQTCYDQYLSRDCVQSCSSNDWISDCMAQETTACYIQRRDQITDPCLHRCESPLIAPALHSCLKTVCNSSICHADPVALCDSAIDAVTPIESQIYRAVCSSAVQATTCAVAGDQCEMACRDWQREPDACAPLQESTMCYWQSSSITTATLASSCNAAELSGCNVNSSETAVSCTISNCHYSQLNTTECTITNCLCNRTHDPTILPCVGTVPPITIQPKAAPFETIFELIMIFIGLTIALGIRVYHAIDPVGVSNRIYILVTPEEVPKQKTVHVPRPVTEHL